jgi:hypothetical protein
MTLILDKDNNVIVYSLEKTVSYARSHQCILNAQCVLWLAASIGLQDGVAIDIDNIRTRTEAYVAPVQVVMNTAIHPESTAEICSPEWAWEDSRIGHNGVSCKSEIEYSTTAGNQLHNVVLRKCRKFE